MIISWRRLLEKKNCLMKFNPILSQLFYDQLQTEDSNHNTGKFAEKTREALTPPKIWVKYIYPPKKGHNAQDPPKGRVQNKKCHKLWKKSIIFLTPPLP